jgi:hypothetical protein
MKPQHKQYLDDLRASGTTNMFGASQYLIWEFPELNKNEARAILSEWMKSHE